MTGVYRRAFTVTGTCMPVWHLMKNDDDTLGNLGEGPSNVKEDFEVELQHLKEYNYAELCCRDKISTSVDKIEEEERRALAEKERVAQERNDMLKEEGIRTLLFVEKSNALLANLHSALMRIILPHIELIHVETGKSNTLLTNLHSALQGLSSLTSTSFMLKQGLKNSSLVGRGHQQ